MKTFYDEQKRAYRVDTDSPLGDGAEGFVCNIEGMPDKVAKILKDNATDAYLKEASQKISAMSNMFAGLDPDRRAAISSQITWPEITLFDSAGKFCGFIMQKITGHKTLDHAYAESQTLSRRFTFFGKVLIAQNLCIAVNQVHRLRCVVGDFNPRNIMVDVERGTVFLCDADSFHLRAKSIVRGREVQVYLPTKKGRPELEPPELHAYAKAQKASLETLPQPSFNLESDLFALAIHIFQLLMNGTHPYALAINPADRVGSIGSVDVSWVANIREGRYVYSTDPAVAKKVKGYIPPSYAPDFKIFSPPLQKLFERAFVTDASAAKTLARSPGDGKYFTMDNLVRPSAAEWYHALDAFKKHLRTCRKNSSHLYGDHLTACPWCD